MSEDLATIIRVHPMTFTKADNTFLSMRMVVQRKLIPWATTRTSIRKLFRKGSKLRYFVEEKDQRKRFFTTHEWIADYKDRVQKQR